MNGWVGGRTLGFSILGSQRWTFFQANQAFSLSSTVSRVAR